MYRFLAYIKHVFTSTNQHGVHSPFVYAFVTKCLYSKDKNKTTKSENVLLKSIPYFACKVLKIDSENPELSKKLIKLTKIEASEKPPFDIIYTDIPSNMLVYNHKERLHNDSLVLIANIHKNKEATSTWNTLKQEESVTVSIDLFYCGALFFRKEQAKEHFKIRI